MLGKIKSALAISIRGEPPSAAQISAIRSEIADNNIGLKVMLYCPIPVVDMIAGLATAGLDYAINGDRASPWHDDILGTKRDWSGSQPAHIYVQKVRGMNRWLVKAEVEALERHLQLEAAARGVAAAVCSGITQGVKDAVQTALKNSTGPR